MTPSDDKDICAIHDHCFKAVEQKLESGIELLGSKIDGHFGIIDQKLQSGSQNMKELDNRLDKAETTIDKIKGRILFWAGGLAVLVIVVPLAIKLLL